MRNLHVEARRFLMILGLLIVTSNISNGQVIWDRAQIDRVRNGKYDADTPVGAALQNLRQAADRALKNPSHSVTQKSILPPSGDKHDYLSFSRYWWPDPDKPDGLPYIRKDGVTNRKLIAKGDRVRLGDFCNDVQTLGLAGYIFEDPRYTRHAADLVRAWFLDDATRMNPNLNFGQGVPGRTTGRGSGVIDTRGFMLVLDAVELFDSENWSDQDQRRLQTWFDGYQQWLTESDIGQHEQHAENNHGSWYAAQRARYALFAGQEDEAQRIVRQAQNRIATQFDRDGFQAAELKRTRSLHYSLFNISALSMVARVGDRLGENLWEFTPDHGCSLRNALDKLLPYLTGELEWKHRQIAEFSLSASSHATLRLFAQQFDDEAYLEAARKIKIRHAHTDFSRLVIGNKHK